MTLFSRPSHRRPLLWALVLGALALAIPQTATAADPEKLVVIGVSGLRWYDVEASPELTGLIDDADVASISVKSSTQQTCPFDGWLTISAGTRAWGTSKGESCPALPAPVDGRLPDWQKYVDTQIEHSTSAQLGKLGTYSSICGFGPGAALAVADSKGLVDNWQPTFVPSDLANCQSAIIDGGIMPLREGRDEARTKLAVLVEQIRATGAQVLLIGVSEEQAGAHRAVQVALRIPAAGDDPRWLTSGSTRRPGLIQLADITETLLRTSTATIKEPPDGGVLTVTGSTHNDAAAVIEDRLDTNQRFDQPRKILTLVGISLVLLQLAAIAWFKFRPSRTSRAVLVGSLLTQCGFFSAVFLATVTNWWRFPEAGLALYVAVIGIAAGLVGLSFAALRRNLALGLALAAYLTLVVDGVLGTPMQVGSMFADGPVIGGRYYGFGNSTFAAFAVATLVLAYAAGRRLLAKSRTQAAAAVLAIGGLAIIVEGVPAWGADFGGVIALTPAVLLLTWITWRGSISWRALLGLGLTGFVAVAAFALADYARPADERSHFGSFVARLLDGDAGDVFVRKIRMALGPLHTVGGWIMLLAVVLALIACLAPQKVPSATFRAYVENDQLVRPTLLALAVCGFVGMVLNDAGVTVPAIMIGFALPLAIAHLVAQGNGIAKDTAP
ncbi:hypothetical protein OG394_28805 [Kribbella sp. NBC_01245]|uniref:hypothetical protein n=1 Tax=Kribbella sp. NBC_01245 TaxID=2903578 RepID=UPI002E2BFD79|nr:hypothetical protein [Kribbella sp. NBC_01245]